jgi:hypothetical protein
MFLALFLQSNTKQVKTISLIDHNMGSKILPCLNFRPQARGRRVSRVGARRTRLVSAARRSARAARDRTRRDRRDRRVALGRPCVARDGNNCGARSARRIASDAARAGGRDGDCGQCRAKQRRPGSGGERECGGD